MKTKRHALACVVQRYSKFEPLSSQAIIFSSLILKGNQTKCYGKDGDFWIMFCSLDDVAKMEYITFLDFMKPKTG